MRIVDIDPTFRSSNGIQREDLRARGSKTLNRRIGARMARFFRWRSPTRILSLMQWIYITFIRDISDRKHARRYTARLSTAHSVPEEESIGRWLGGRARFQ